MGALTPVASSCGDVVYLHGDHDIGRSERSRLVLTHPAVSSFHALIRWVGDRWMLRDLGSRNGTFVNGIRVAGARVPDGAKIQLGSTVIARASSNFPGPVPFSPKSRTTSASAGGSAGEGADAVGCAEAVGAARGVAVGWGAVVSDLAVVVDAEGGIGATPPWPRVSMTPAATPTPIKAPTATTIQASLPPRAGSAPPRANWPPFTTTRLLQ